MQPYEIRPLEKNNSQQAAIVCAIYADNQEALHGAEITALEWEKSLSEEDPDEQHFLIYSKQVPVAWMKINGLLDKEMAWISMLAVSRKYHRQGIGCFAIQFAEDFVREKGFRKLGIHTTEDNLPALNAYQKSGYIVTEFGNCTTGDGAARTGFTFEKELAESPPYR